MAKRPSGGRRRTLRKQGLPPGRPGRPEGRAGQQTQELLANLRRDLAWLAEPHLSDSALSRDLLEPKESKLDLVQVLVKHEPKYLHFYNCIGDRAFRRHVAAVQEEIWPYRKPRKAGEAD
jgi:hypothetical protein